MGWLSKFFKGSSHNVSEGQYDWGYGTNSVENYPSTSWDAWSETEDIDRAIALSLSEEDKKGKIVIDDESQLKEDEQLARAIQESLNFESPPPIVGNVSGNVIGNGIFYRPIPFPYSTSFSWFLFFTFVFLPVRTTSLYGVCQTLRQLNTHYDHPPKAWKLYNPTQQDIFPTWPGQPAA